MDSGQQEALDKILAATLARVIDFNKFAEAKNAALLTFASAWTIALGNVLASDKPIPRGYETSSEIAIALFIVSLLIAITSFLPKIKLSNFMKTDHRASNLLFFGDISALRIPDYQSQVMQRYAPATGEACSSEYLKDLTNQIAVNSLITMRKFRHFNVGVTIALIGILILPAPTIVHIARRFVGYL